MKLMKGMLISTGILAVFIAFAMVGRSVSQERKQTQTGAAQKYVVIGSLQSRDKIVTISQGPKGIVYTIQTKDGKTVAKRLKEKDLQAKYPGIYQQIKSGLAANDATLRIPATRRH